MVAIAQWVGQQGSQALGTGSNPNIYLCIFHFIRTILSFFALFFLYSYHN